MPTSTLATCVSSRRLTMRGYPPSSTTTMTTVAFLFLASASAAAATFSATSRVRTFFSASWARTTVGDTSSNKAVTKLLMVFMLGSFPDLAQQELLGFRRAGSQSIGTGDGKLFVLLRGGGAADAHGHDDLLVDAALNDALCRREIIGHCYTSAAVAYHG